MTDNVRSLPLTQEKSADVHLETAPFPEEKGVLDAKDERLLTEATRAEQLEHELTTWQAVKAYKHAVFWSFLASLSIVMEGYDWTIQGSFWSILYFRKVFGTYDAAIQDWQVSAAWQSGIGQAPSVGSIFGVYWGGWLNDRVGYRKALIINFAFIIPVIAILTFAQNKPMLLVGSILEGIPFGAFACLGEAYASEICPMILRPYLTGYVNLCWCIGDMVGAGVCVGTQGMPNSWSWRIPFATQWVWPVPIMIGCYFAPESPYWLVRHGRLEEAEVSVKRLASAETRERSHETLANIIRTTQLEMEFSNAGKDSQWLEMFKGTNLRRTEITVMVWVTQIMSGYIFASKTSYVFEQAGISQTQAFDLGLGQEAVQLMANFLNMYLMYYFGRRSIYIFGFVYSTIILIAVGIAGVYGERGVEAAKWVQGGFQIAFFIGYTGFLGPVCYAILGETSSTRLRNKTIAFGRMVYSVVNLCMGVLGTYMINASEWNWQGKTAFFWAPMAALSAVWCYYRLPEFKNRTFYEIDILFEKRVSARDFKKAVVAANEEENLRAQ